MIFANNDIDVNLFMKHSLGLNSEMRNYLVWTITLGLYSVDGGFESYRHMEWVQYTHALSPSLCGVLIQQNLISTITQFLNTS